MATRRRFRGTPRGNQIRVNHRIRVPEVLVVDADGSNLGVLPTQEALKRAREANLDLVEINPKGNPPVCKILDFGKFKYDESKRKRETKRKQTIVEIKEIKLRPKTDDHDLDFKMRSARKFLESGNKVKIVCRFRGREITHPEVARGQLEEIMKGTEDLANVELRPTMEGRAMALLLAPKQAILQRVAQEKVRREQEREEERKQQRTLDEKERAERKLRQADPDNHHGKISINELLEKGDGATSEEGDDEEYDEDGEGEEYYDDDSDDDDDDSDDEGDDDDGGEGEGEGESDEEAKA